MRRAWTLLALAGSATLTGGWLWSGPAAAAVPAPYCGDLATTTTTEAPTTTSSTDVPTTTSSTTTTTTTTTPPAEGEVVYPDGVCIQVVEVDALDSTALGLLGALVALAVGLYVSLAIFGGRRA